MMWMVLSIASEDGEVIFHDQFVQLVYLLQSALLGPASVDREEALREGEQEWLQNIAYYGELSQFAFNDILAECIGGCAVVVGQHGHAGVA